MIPLHWTKRAYERAMIALLWAITALPWAITSPEWADTAPEWAGIASKWANTALPWVLAHFDFGLVSESGSRAIRSAISHFRDSTPDAIAGVTPFPREEWTRQKL
jgi:hypothetical protein